MTESGDLTPPQSKYSKTKIGTEASLAAIPGVGGSAAALFSGSLQAVYDERRADWQTRVAERVVRLEDEGIAWGDLDRERFASAFARASVAAMGTHLEAKLEMLAECVISASLPNNDNDFIAVKFLNFVDELTPEHFVLLSLFEQPSGWCQRIAESVPLNFDATSRPAVLEEILGLDAESVNIAIKDLDDRELIQANRIPSITKDGGGSRPVVLGLGKQLLGWVRRMGEAEASR